MTHIGIPAQSPTVCPCCMLAHSRYCFGVFCGIIRAGLFALAERLTANKNRIGDRMRLVGVYCSFSGCCTPRLTYIDLGGQ